MWIKTLNRAGFKEFLMRFFFLSFVFLFASCSRLTPNKTGMTDKDIFNPSYIENIDPFYRPGNLPIGYATPLMDDEGVYFGTPNGEVKKYVYSLKRSFEQIVLPL